MIVADGGSSSAVAPQPRPQPQASPKPPAAQPVASQPDRIERSSGTATAGLAGALPHVAAGSTYHDTTGAFENVANGKLPPSATIVENGYTFTTDEQGRVSGASGQLTTSSADPKRTTEGKAAQREVGWEDRLDTDHGGHLIGHRFNGPDDLHNLFAQNGNFNTGEYKKVENSWAKAIDEGKRVNVKVELSYPNDSLRPSQVTVKSRVDDGPWKTRVFENKERGGLPDPKKAGGPKPDGGVDAADATRSAANDAEGASTAAKTAESAAEASRFAKGAEIFGKVALPVAVAADGYSLYSAYKQDGDKIGKQTVEQAGSVAGGWAGAAVGAEAGAEGGAAIGALFGGVGAVPGAIIGGAVGGIAGGLAGSEIGKGAVKLGEDAIDAGKSAVHSVANFFGL